MYGSPDTPVPPEYVKPVVAPVTDIKVVPVTCKSLGIDVLTLNNVCCSDIN